MLPVSLVAKTELIVLLLAGATTMMLIWVTLCKLIIIRTPQMKTDLPS